MKELQQHFKPEHPLNQYSYIIWSCRSQV